jgi:putative methyltransferase (TIGR04325 family)
MSVRIRLYNILKSIVKKYLLGSSKYGWFGNYSSWNEAQAQSTGYDTDLILNKVLTALLKVKNGEAVYERDSVNFDEIQYSWGTLSGLLLSSQANKGHLTILDFGGSLGSVYFQNRNALKYVTNLKWNIIEQSHFVKSGKEHFSNYQLFFHETIESYADLNDKTDVLLLSSVIQYLESPFEMLDKLLELNPSMIIIDITTFTNFSNHIITVQKVPPHIYNASYPCWFFDFNLFSEYFIKKGYFKMGDWKLPYEINFGFHAGLLFTKAQI